MGSAALLLNKPRSNLEVLNDLDSDLTCFMGTLADREKGKELVERLCELRYGEVFFNEAFECKKRNFYGMDEIDKAVMVYILITQSFNCLRKSFSRKAYRDTNQYNEGIRFHIPKVYERLKDVQVFNMNGIDLLNSISDNKSAFVFLDPPYRAELRGTHADKAYACEMPHSEQIRLLKAIRTSQCKIMLCGYKCEIGLDLYDTYLLPYGWKCYKLKDLVKASQTCSGHKDMGSEYIWINYDLPYAAKYVIAI